MGAIWARRQKVVASSSSKRKHTELAEGHVSHQKAQLDPRGDRAAGGTTIYGSNEETIEQAIEVANFTGQPTEEQGHSKRVKKTGPAEALLPGPAEVMHHSRLFREDTKHESNTSSPAYPAPAHIRLSTAVDFQRDICKQYKLKGTCSYGDSCKFLHEREDHSAGAPRAPDWDIGAGKSKHLGAGKRKSNEDESPIVKVTKGCSVCRSDPPERAVRPACGHIVCEKCFIKVSKNATAKCTVCYKRLGQAAEVVHEALGPQSVFSST